MQSANTYSATEYVDSSIRLKAWSGDIRALMTEIAECAAKHGGNYEPQVLEQKIERAEIPNPHITAPNVPNAEGFLGFSFESRENLTAFETGVRELIANEKVKRPAIQAEFDRPTGAELI